MITYNATDKIIIIGYNATGIVIIPRYCVYS